MAKPDELGLFSQPLLADFWLFLLFITLNHLHSSLYLEGN